MVKTGSLLLSSCWKHYGVLMRLEDRKFSHQHKELLDQYLSGIKVKVFHVGITFAFVSLFILHILMNIYSFMQTAKMRNLIRAKAAN